MFEFATSGILAWHSAIGAQYMQHAEGYSKIRQDVLEHATSRADDARSLWRDSRNVRKDIRRSFNKCTRTHG